MIIIPEWAQDAFLDSVNLIPLLFVVFLSIEILEYFYANKINALLKKTGKYGVLIGAIAAIFPQCGFSVIASGLYIKRIITIGTLVAVYLATSDETIPILLATPSKAHFIIPIISIKLFIGILTGYLVDAIFREHTKTKNEEIIVESHGCCKHEIGHLSKRELIIHPILHTLNVFCFILFITLILNFCLENVEFAKFIQGGKFIQPIIASFIGLIPNCAVSIALTMMLIKGTITFGAAMSGLLSNAGLGLLLLIKSNNFKDNLRIVLILVITSIISGITINLIMH